MRTRNFANWVRFGPRTVRETVFQLSEFDSNLVLFLSLGMTMLNYHGGKHHNCFWKPGKDKFKSFILSSLSSELFFQLTGYLSKHLTTSDSPCPILTTLLPHFCHVFLKILPHPCRGNPSDGNLTQNLRDLSGNLFTKLDLTHLVKLEKLILDENEKLYLNEVDRARNSRNKENQSAAINLPTGLSHL